MKKYLLKIYILIIIVLSLGPIHLIFPNLFKNDDNSYPFLELIPLDKIGHFVMYLILGLMTQKYYDKNLRYLIVAIFFGILMEILQYPIPYRGFDFLDMAANIIGVGITCPLFLQRKRAS